MRCSIIAVLVLAVFSAPSAAAQKLTGNLTSGITCTPDAGGLIGSGCPKDEGCCPTTNTCVKINTCSDYVKVCPPPTCGKDASFSDTECPAEATKIFKSPKNLKCQQSRDTVCSSNGTAMVVACRSGAGSIGVQLLVVVAAAMAAIVLMSA